MNSKPGKTATATAATRSRRMGVAGAKNRTRFVDAAEAILRNEGYKGISARQVAARAELKTQLLYYYFRTMDDLIRAVVQRINERRLEKFHAALNSAEPLKALWQVNSDPSSATISAELTSIATHREAIRAEIVQSAEQFRTLQIQAVARLLAHHNQETDYPAAGIVLIAVGLARTIISESALGLTVGHKEALMIMERVLKDFSDARSSP